jgi:hypothetical protein
LRRLVSGFRRVNPGIIRVFMGLGRVLGGYGFRWVRVYAGWVSRGHEYEREESKRGQYEKFETKFLSESNF